MKCLMSVSLDTGPEIELGSLKSRSGPISLSQYLPNSLDNNRHGL